MLGTVPSQTRERELLERIEQIAESIAYTAPELAEAKRAEIVTAIRREIRDWRAGQ